MKRIYIVYGILFSLFCMMYYAAFIYEVDAITVSTEQTLVNKVIVIDPGHGGADPGAIAGKIHEDKINLAISIKLKSMLEAKGATVYLTRDENYNYGTKKSDDLYIRSQKIDSYNPHIFVSIHLNAAYSSRVHGSQVFYHRKSESGQKLAVLINAQLKKVTKSDKGALKGDYYVLRATKAVGVLVECGFLSNPNERGQLVGSKHQDKLAAALTVAIDEYFK